MSIAAVLRTHFRAQVYQGHHGRNIPDAWQHYFLFSVVRNPYSREVSTYQHMARTKINRYHDIVRRMTFDQYVQWRTQTDLCETNRLTQTRFVFGDHLEWRDCMHLLRFEHLEEDFRQLPFVKGMSIRLLHINQGSPVEWQSYYTNPKTQEAVARYFAEDFTRFGYSLEIA